MATFRLDAPGDFPTQFEKRKQAGIETQKQRSIVDLARPALQADIAQSRAQTQNIRSRTKQREEMLPFEKGEAESRIGRRETLSALDKINSQKAKVEVERMLQNEDTFEILKDVEKARGEAVLDYATNNPEQFRKDVAAEMRLKSSQADLNTLALQTEAEFSALTQLEDVFTNQGVEGVQQALPYVNQQYQDATGSPLLPPNMPVNLDTMGLLRSRRDALLHNRDYLSSKMRAEIQGGQDPRLMAQFQQDTTEWIKNISGPKLANTVGAGEYDVDSSGEPLLAEYGGNLDPSEISNVHSEVNSTLQEIYGQTGSTIAVEDASDEIGRGLQQIQADPVTGPQGGVANTIAPRDMTQSQVDEMASNFYKAYKDNSEVSWQDKFKEAMRQNRIRKIQSIARTYLFDNTREQ